MTHSVTTGRRLALGILSLALWGPVLAQTGPVADPLKELVGQWHGLHEKVVYEVKSNGDVVVVENNSASETIKNEKFAPGLVIAQLTSYKFDGAQYRFTGKCWTRGGGKPDYWLQPCPEVAVAYFETRDKSQKKPYWKLSVNYKGMLRKENLGSGGQGRK